MLHGFGLSGYRSFGDQFQEIGPLTKVNALVGENNVGKSNVLRFASTILEDVLANRYPSSAHPSNVALDRHHGSATSSWRIGFAVPAKAILGNELWKRSTPQALALIGRLVSSVTDRESGLVWFRYRSDDLGKAQTTFEIPAFDHKRAQPLNRDEWGHLWSSISGRSGGDLTQHWIPETYRTIADAHRPKVVVKVLPAFRRITSQGFENGTIVSTEDNSGRGLIERLSRIQSPTFGDLRSREMFGNITDFVRAVLGESTAAISVPHDKSMVLVRVHNREFPLESFGTGLQELIVMAAYASVYTDSLMCIEEPEIHLHPMLQKKLITYLVDKTSNQYLIATHSAHILNCPGVSVFQLTADAKGATHVAHARTDGHKRSLCADLGYAPSDLLQSNCTVWVEGPSDRLYLVEWIRQSDPSLIEGVHYSVMFFGGTGMLSHLSGDDSPTSDFVALTKLARRACMVIDGDKDSGVAVLTAQKQRIRDELVAHGGHVWITDSLAIENYIHPNDLESAVKAVHPNAVALVNRDQYTDNTLFSTADPAITGRAKKVAVAHAVVQTGLPVGRYDIKDRIAEIVGYIHASNRK